MEDAASMQSHLDNIRAIQPVLSALRTSSLARWQSALKQVTALDVYQQRLQKALPALLRLPPIRHDAPHPGRDVGPTGTVVLLLIGSERRLCGDYNVQLADWVEQHRQVYQQGTAQLDLICMGRPLAHLLDAMPDDDHATVQVIDRHQPDAFALTCAREWLHLWIYGDLQAVHGLYNAYEGVGRSRTTCDTLLPPQPITHMAADPDPWTQPIIETDPMSLVARILEQLIAVGLLRLLTVATASENAVRYQLMENALDNLEQLIDELESDYHLSRRRAITREIQVLTSAARLSR